MKLIDKDALVAEIEKLRKNAWESFKKGNSTEEQYYIRYGVIQDILISLDTIETKEVDLKKELSTYLEVVKATDEDIDFVDFAKHFFELGMLSTITEEDCKLIWNIGDSLSYMPEEDFFKELLRRFKAQKEE